MLVKNKDLTLNQPHLWDCNILDDFGVHVNEGASLGLAIKDAEGGCEVEVLGGPSNGSPGNNGRFRRHDEMVRGGDVETAEDFCGRLRETPS